MHYMRSLLFASIAALAFPACVQDISGGKPGDDTGGGATCGNGTVESGESCDDGNTASGDGCSAGCQIESTTAPRVDATLDKASLTTELNKSETFMMSVTSANGFSGTVTIAAAIANATSGTADPAVQLTVPPTVDLVAGQTTTVPIDLKIASDATGTDLSDKLTLTLTSSAGTAIASSPIVVKALFTVVFADGTNNVPSQHAAEGKNYTVKRGAMIRFTNDDSTVVQHIIHGDGTIFPHEQPTGPDTTTQIKGKSYDVKTIGLSPGSVGQLGCHSHNSTATYTTFTVM
jgi:cysteine-rich repeat protein